MKDKRKTKNQLVADGQQKPNLQGGETMKDQKKMKRIAKISALLLLAVVVLAACRPQEVERPPDEVTVQLVWYHQAQFAGFYAADQQGYYAEECLAVTLLPLAGPAPTPWPW